MITALGIIGAIIGVMLCDVIGRRPLLLFGLGLAAIFNAVVGGLGTKGNLTQSEIHAVVASFVFVVIGNKMGVNVLCCEYPLITWTQLMCRPYCIRARRPAPPQEE